jgi:hypothetical protein
VLEIKYWILLVALVIVCRSIDETAAHRLLDFRPVLALTYLTVWDILVECIVCGNFR